MSGPVADSAREGTSAHLDEWAQYFRDGGVFTAPVDALNRGSVPVVFTIMLGVVALALALGVWRLWTTRQRLHAARVSPQYVTISQSGVRIADVIELPWGLSIGVVVLTGDSRDGSGKRRLGAAAGNRLRRLFEVIGEGGALRVPLDSVRSPTSTAQELYLGKPILAAARAEHTRAMTAAAVASTAAAAANSSPYAAVAVMFGRALAAASPAGLVLRGAANVAQDPARAPSSAAPADEGSPPAASLSIDELANAALGSAGREIFDDARSHLAAHGPESFGIRFPETDHTVSGAGPTDIQLLLNMGLSPHGRSIGWCDWSGEDDPGQVLDFVEQSCRTLWQSVPFWPAATAVGRNPVISALHRADEGLSRAGQRLLLIDDDSDTAYFVPVKRPVFAALAGRAGNGFRLTGVENG